MSSNPTNKKLNEIEIVDNDSTSLTKYFRIFVFSAPISNLRSYTQGLRRIFEELEKT
jgi:hypothetical protein